LGDPLVSEEHITAFGWATPPELDEIMQPCRCASMISCAASSSALAFKLVDFKIEFGRLWENDHATHHPG
jgi:phosphoribosylaminoimidazole-succinocarboxamide synthase